MFTKRKKKPIQLEHQLTAIPVRNAKAEIIEDSADKFIVAVPLEYTGLMIAVSRFYKLAKKKEYQLSGLSRDLLMKLDGKLTVEDLIDQLMDEYKLTFFESRALVIEYLKTLMTKGLIAVDVEVTPHRDP